MGRKPDEHITSDIGREICLRDGIKAMLTGSIASLGNHYVITLAATNAQTGDSLGREQVEADSKEQVLKSLDQAASNLRQKMGESLASIQQFATPPGAGHDLVTRGPQGLQPGIRRASENE